MKDGERENKQLGIYEDPVGDVSSGRIMKLQAFWTALVLTAAGLIAIIVLGVTGNESTAAEVTKYLQVSIAMYLGVATGAEIVQKVTGK